MVGSKGSPFLLSVVRPLKQAEEPGLDEEGPGWDKEGPRVDVEGPEEEEGVEWEGWMVANVESGCVLL